MSRTPDDVLALIKDRAVKYVDLRFTDSRGKQQHLTVPAGTVDAESFETGTMFDGSAIDGWKGIDESDMMLLPDPGTAVLDPFFDERTLILVCDIIEPSTMRGYERDPRSIAKRAEIYLQSTGLADTALFGPENEFFIFDDARWDTDINASFFQVDSAEASWNAGREYPNGNMGHRPGIKGGYSPVPPVDSLHDIRSAMCEALEAMGLQVEMHHHEVATAGQCEIGVRYAPLVRKADQVQTLKYAVQNVAHAYGKTVTFMPKPLAGDNGSGMHVHQSLAQEGSNLFIGDLYGGLSATALYYIGGIIKHAHALNAFTNPSTNSYRRLVPNFEAPVLLAYSAQNRSASIRIPYVTDPRARRIEARFPDAAANPYLAFAAMLMAGLDGIQNKIHPGDPADKDLYDLPPEEERDLPKVAVSLRHALAALDSDREFLKRGGVFTDSAIDAYIRLKLQDMQRLQTTPHPLEYELYYSV